jgi:uncharacterized protein
MQVILDTNVWVSGIFSQESKSGLIINQWHSDKMEIIMSDVLLAEIHKVLLYPKIFKRLKMSNDDIERYIDAIKFFTKYISIKNNQFHDSDLKDMNDQFLLAMLQETGADYLITGDNDLLVLAHKYPIITIADFCDKHF